MSESERAAQAGVADAIGQLSEQTRVLVRREIEAVQREMLDRGRQAGPGIALAAAAAVFSLLAGASAYRWSLRLLEKVLPPASAAFVSMTLCGAAAGGAAVAGARRLRTAPAPVPVDTAAVTGAAARAAARGDAAGGPAAGS